MRSFEAIAHGAVLLTTNNFSRQTLDDGLRDRVVYLDEADMAAAMRTALSRDPQPLTAAQRHYLSVDRFLEQIFSLLKSGAAEREKRRHGS